jgi:Mrp family chromosome partitioning ATPase
VAAPAHAHLQLLLSSREQLHRVDLLDAQRFAKLLERLERETDVVVIDSPPVPEVAEALALASAAETVILCVRIGHTRRDKLGELRDLLARRGVTPLGLFVTSRDRPQPVSSDYDYSTGMTSTPSTSFVPEPEPLEQGAQRRGA